jgi:hypothetical protein
MNLKDGMLKCEAIGWTEFLGRLIQIAQELSKGLTPITRMHQLVALFTTRDMSINFRRAGIQSMENQPGIMG